MPGDDAKFSSVPIKQPELDWNVTNWSQEFSAFKRICKLLLEDGLYSDLIEKQKVTTLLNWLGWTAHQLHDEFDYTGTSKDKLADVLEKFSNYFKPQHNRNMHGIVLEQSSVTVLT